MSEVTHMNLLLSAAMKARLEMLARFNGRPTQDLVREALNEYLTKKGA